MPQPPEDVTADDARGDGDRLEARLARIESAVTDLSTRLAEVERQLNASSQQARQTETRPFGQGATLTTEARPTARDERAHAEPSVGAWRDAEETASDEARPQSSVESRVQSSDKTQAGGAAFDESRTVEDFPFGVSRVRGKETADQFESSQPPQASAVARARRDFESLVGGSWFNWLGIIAVTLGVGFFLKYAFENQWIGPTGRVLLGGAAGCAILALAERLRARGYRAYAHVLTGGGILILYLSAYAAAPGFYNLVGVTLAFALMSVVTATAVLLAVRYDALPIAVLALIGGFMTPVLLRTDVDRQIALFTYVAFLDAGVLAIAYFKRWRVLNYLAFAATVLLFAGWLAARYEPWKLWRTLLFLTLYFLMFSALAVVHNLLRRRRANWLDLSLVIANATLYFATSYALLYEEHHDLLGAFAFAVAVFYALLAFAAHSRHREDRLLSNGYVAAAATFAAIAVAAQFDQHWVTIGWAAEAVALTWLGLRVGVRAPRRFALVAFAFAALHWLTVDLFAVEINADTHFVPLLNARAFSCLAVVAALACAVWLNRRPTSRVGDAESATITAALTLTCAALVLVLLSADANDYFAQRLARASFVLSDERGRLENTKQLTLSLIWTLYAAGFAAFGVVRRLRFLRFAGLLWLTVAALKILAVDARFYATAWHAPLFNQTFAAFAVFVAAVWYVAHTYAHAEGVDEEEWRGVVMALTVVGNLFAVAALSLEASGYFRKQLAERAAAGLNARDLRLARQLSLSLVWAVYGGALLFFGHARGNKTLRLMALALLTATTVKVFFFDLSELEKFYRIVSFIVLGLVLLAVSFLYQQRRAREAEEA